MTIEEQAADVLQRSACHSLSLQQLHALLERETAGRAGTYHELHLRLKQKSQQFSVVCRPRPWGDNELWTGTVREAYASAIEQAGVDTSPVVTLIGRDLPQGDLVDTMRATLLDLKPELELDPVAREDLLFVLTGVE